eukprot:495403-Pyramimonas_sp.AAC.1
MSMVSKLQCLADRLYKLGLTCSGQWTRGRVVATVLAFGMPTGHGIIEPSAKKKLVDLLNDN